MLALTNVRLIDVQAETPVESGVLLVEGGRIVYAGPAAAAPAPGPDAVIVDGEGRSAVPGLANCHTHLTVDERDVERPRRVPADGEMGELLRSVARARRCLQNGITTLRDCNAPTYGPMALRAAFADGTLPGPRLFVSGHAICATGGHMHTMSFEADGPDMVRRGVREQLKAGADFIKLVAEASSGSGAFDRPSLQLTVDEMRAAVEVAHRTGKQVTAHAVTRYGVRDALDAGVDCVEHGYDLTDELIELMRARNTWLVPTLSVHGAMLRRADEMRLTADRRSISERILETGLRSVERARQAGVRIACGSDAGSPLNPVWEIVPELRLLCQAGFRPGEALTAATLRAAELIGVEHDQGKLEAGKRADVVLVDGDPLASVEALSKVVMVLKDGEIVANFRRELRAAG
jgi:imidazolonepropionase-like amidohydrolase